MIYRLLLALSILFVCACEDNEEKYNYKYNLEVIQMNDGSKIKVYKDSTMEVSNASLNYDGEYLATDYDSVVGYRKHDLGKHYIRLIVKEDFPQFHLKANEQYYAKVINYYHEIPARSTEYITPFSLGLGHMGFRGIERKPYEINCEVVGRNRMSGDLIHKTRILQIEYKNKERIQNLYFPSHPQSLVWYFYREDRPRKKK